VQRLAQTPTPSAKAQLKGLLQTNAQSEKAAPIQPDPHQSVQDSAQTEAAQVDADLASELIASGVTTQPVETVVVVLGASRDGASINASAKAAGINYRTAQRIVEAAEAMTHRQLAAAG
jgi:type IV pilus biogenesis protein CpaD/CtpE